MHGSTLHKISNKAVAILVAALASLLLPVAAQAQFSDTYNFMRGVRDRDFATVRDLVEQPGSTVINIRDRSTGDAALHIVTRERDSQWLLYLLRQNANPDIRDREGNTPLHIAAQIGYLEAADWLRIVDADLNARNNRGETPLILAVQQRNAALVRQLVDAGANPDIADSVIGLSARDYAVRDGRSGDIVAIIEAGPEITAEEEEAVVGPSVN
ncbi:ankyrin repeat domain-containing protein [Parasphingopyxis lamellibrachiae]|uniref:Ankyrin repeat protein n=1 Tax=Parasphingopyxis lamellibrachiae TaxID=680125 RepID=A0A3D9FHP8_9SPHN|nr:ankyrin repeat domain-containing protein [Parasphingopyxis lamellibrachiae]RED17107.1 ankyrin repeat protein [Parasphingopyxis lamellibrachiae]